VLVAVMEHSQPDSIGSRRFITVIPVIELVINTGARIGGKLENLCLVKVVNLLRSIEVVSIWPQDIVIGINGTYTKSLQPTTSLPEAPNPTGSKSASSITRRKSLTVLLLPTGNSMT